VLPTPASPGTAGSCLSRSPSPCLARVRAGDRGTPNPHLPQEPDLQRLRAHKIGILHTRPRSNLPQSQGIPHDAYTCITAPAAILPFRDSPASSPLKQNPAFLLGRAANLSAHSEWMGLISQGQILPPHGRTWGRALPRETPQLGWQNDVQPGKERGAAASPDCCRHGSQGCSQKQSAPWLLGRWRQVLQDGKGKSMSLHSRAHCGFGQVRTVALGADGLCHGHCSPLDQRVPNPAQPSHGPGAFPARPGRSSAAPGVTGTAGLKSWDQSRVGTEGASVAASPHWDTGGHVALRCSPPLGACLLQMVPLREPTSSRLAAHPMALCFLL